MRFFNPRRIIGSGWLARVLAVSALVLLQSCSAIKLGYNNGVDVGYWWVDAYADFNDTQAPIVRAELARLLQWHRTEELPKIAELLQKAQRLAAADTTPAPVCALFADTRERFEAVTNQAEKAVAGLALTFTPSQIKRIESKFSKNNAEWRKDWFQLSPKELFERRLKSNVERAQEFYGTLEERQLGVLRAALESSSYDPQLSYVERQRRQQDLLQTLRQTTTVTASGTTTAALTRSPAEALTALRAYMERANTSPNPVYRAYSDKLTTESCASFAALHNSTTPAQRERAVRRLAAYERDARELNSQR